MSGSVKINFRVRTLDIGYPPVAVESLWANPSTTGFVIDSIPFFACDATTGDRVAAHRGEGDALWFDNVLQRSGNSLIRAVFFDESCQDDIVGHLTRLGCGTERMPQFKLLAIDVPQDVSLLAVQSYLMTQAAAGLIDYEEPLLRQ